MAIKNYPNKAAYDAAVKPTMESQVSMIETTREIIADGVNVITTEPAPGDLVMLDESNTIRYLKGGSWIQKAIIPSAWTHVGYVVARKGRKVLVIDKTGTDEKYLDVCQYAITAISSTTLAIKLRMSPDYAVDTTVDVTLTSTAIDATSASEISAAVAAKAEEVGDTKAWWAYLADANGNKVESDGTQIIIQCDECVDYRFYIVSATGCTIALSVWGDMPASDVYWKNDGGYTNYRGVMNRARTRIWATTNGRIPASMEPVVKNGNDDPVRPSCFEDPTAEGYQYCADIRAKFGTYDNYLHYGLGVMYPQKYGSFALPGGAELTKKYGPMMAPTKDGATKAKFPAMNKANILSYANELLKGGMWFLPGCLEGCELVNDETLAILAPSITKMGTTAINNGTHRWFAERYYVYTASLFYGYYGNISTSYVSNRLRVQAVTLLDI